MVALFKKLARCGVVVGVKKEGRWGGRGMGSCA